MFLSIFIVFITDINPVCKSSGTPCSAEDEVLARPSSEMLRPLTATYAQDSSYSDFLVTTQGSVMISISAYYLFELPYLSYWTSVITLIGTFIGGISFHPLIPRCW